MPESLTWSQIYRRARNVAHEVGRRGSPGDRAVILAPQGLDYVAAFLGALEAGRVAVPLSVPFGPGDEHIHAVLRDSQPSVVLTTSSAIDIVSQYVPSDRGASDPSVVEIDSLDLDSPRGLDAPPEPTTAYLQYTSGSTRRPTGVMVSQKNLLTNFGQVMSAYFSDYGKVAPPDTTVVSWVPLSHNMGLFIGLCAPILAGLHTVFTSPMSFIQQPARWMQLLANNSRSFSPAPNFALELAVQTTSDEDMAGCDLGDVMAIISGRRTYTGRDAATLHTAVRSLRPAARGDEAVLWAGRGDCLRRDPRVGSPAGNRALRTGEAIFRAGRAVHERRPGQRWSATGCPGRRT